MLACVDDVGPCGVLDGARKGDDDAAAVDDDDDDDADEDKRTLEADSAW
jgi:hypothetical protein